jgi:hypothetical protein
MRFVKLKIGITHVLPALCLVERPTDVVAREVSFAWEVEEGELPVHLRLARAALDVMGLHYTEKPMRPKRERGQKRSAEE